jgi:hypothetical protein
MKKIIFTLLTLFVVYAVQAQLKVAIKGGYNYSTGKIFYKSVKQPTDAVHGFGLGVLFKTEFEGVLHFSPYFQINSRGFVIKPLTGTYKRIENTIQYLDIVPALSLDFKNGNNAFVISFGPTAGLTSFGKEKKTDQNNVTTSNKIHFGYDGIGWFDLGATISLGYHFKKAFIEAGYYHGLANINNNVEFDGNSLQNRMLSLNLGYYFR